MNIAVMHPDDGALLRVIDGALEDDERLLVETHLRDCGVCRYRTDELRTLTRGFTRLVDTADAVLLYQARRPTMPTPATRRPGRRYLRAAIIPLALGAGLLAAPPVRAWLAGTWTRITQAESTPQATPPAPPEAAPALPPDANAVTFAFTDSVFVLTVDRRQPEGTLTIVFALAPATARAVTDGDAEFLVTIDGLRIINSGEEGDYRVEVPVAVREVRLRIAEEPERGLRAAADEPVRVIQLGGSSQR